MRDDLEPTEDALLAIYMYLGLGRAPGIVSLNRRMAFKGSNCGIRGRRVPTWSFALFAGSLLGHSMIAKPPCMSVDPHYKRVKIPRSQRIHVRRL